MTIKEGYKCQYNMESKSMSNPENRPVEELKIKYKSKKCIYEELIPALDERWCIKDYIYTVFTLPPTTLSDGILPMGSKEDWIERTSLFIDDMNLLLHTPHHKFWSEVVHNNQCLAGLSSFLQCMFPFYLRNNIPKDIDIVHRLKKAQEKVFLLLTRLTTAKETEKEWMKSTTLGSILYNNFVLSLPQLMEICVVYGEENFNKVSELVNRVIEIQPKYIIDIEKSIPFITQVLTQLEHQLRSGKEINGDPCLATMESSHKRSLGSAELGRVIQLLTDISYSLASFLQVCPRAAVIGHNFQLESRIANFYATALPELTKLVNSSIKRESNDDLNSQYHVRVKESRQQLLLVVHSCISTFMGSIIEQRDHLDEEEMKRMVDGYLETVTDCLSAHSFIKDYDKIYPVQRELGVLIDIFPDIDINKYSFILESVASSHDLPKKEKVNFKSGNTLDPAESHESPSDQLKSESLREVTGVTLQSLISEVKDILPHLGDGYITKCLEHFKYVSSDVVNAILENSIPECLLSLDPEMPILPPECDQTKNSHPDRINVYDNDEFDILNRNDVDLSKIHKGKRQDKHKSLSQLLDDKTHVHEMKEVYTQLSLVEAMEDVSLYDDEYDDTYDDVDASIGNEGSTEAEERRTFVTPRVLQQYRRQEERVDEGGEEEEERVEGRSDSFVENPADLRARAEQRRMDARGRGHHSGSRDVVGRPKGQGQDKEVLASREFKNTHKSSRGNHNRRAMAAKKRRQGMFPS